jgi:organic radical activating enzyme
LIESKKHSFCSTFTGQTFLCDTDYHKVDSKSENELVTLLQGERHVCVTGGEPFLHNLTPLVLAMQEAGVTVHVETSGTLPIVFPLVRVPLPSLESDAHLPMHQPFETDLTPETLGHAGIIKRHMLWITCSPKADYLPEALADVNEIKILVGPRFLQSWLEKFLEQVPVQLMDHVYLSPINGVEKASNDSLDICLHLLRAFPSLKLSAQLHKYIGQR